MHTLKLRQANFQTMERPIPLQPEGTRNECNCLQSTPPPQLYARGVRLNTGADERPINTVTYDPLPEHTATDFKIHAPVKTH